MDKYYAEQAAKKAKSKAAMYSRLAKDTRIVQVLVEYAGSSDEGSVEGVEFHDGEGNILELSDSFHDAVSEYVYDSLPGGWEINCGSSGTVTINVKEQKAHFDHEQRYEESKKEPFDD
jgi:hypothetical protein